MPENPSISVRRARALAATAAAREHARLGTSFDQRVRIFDIIEEAGIWLLFQPLDRLYGVYDRQDDAAGVLVHRDHPLSLQRLTAAHEYGHHVLGHHHSEDGEVNILPSERQPNPQEAAAQTFAAYFLMPLPLVNAVLRGMGLPLKPGRLSPRQAYLLSLELGASYAATVNHLAVLGKIAHQTAVALRHETPKAIKTDIGHGIRPQDVWADVWPLEVGDAGRLLYPRVNDELRIHLPESPSTGYIWTVSNPDIVDHRAVQAPAEQERGAYLALTADDFAARSATAEGLPLGGGGTRQLVFRILRPGNETLRLVKRRPWQGSAEPADVFAIDLAIAPKSQGLSERQKQLLALEPVA